MKVKNKKGVASFYIVAFSTLILVVTATSFATVILSEVTRTSNDDLSQSAYDSALAGVEDAKLAFANYQRCKSSGVTLEGNYKPDTSGQVTCKDIIYWMEHPDCDTVGHILGRIPKGETGKEVTVSDTVSAGGGDVSSNMNQAYSCATITTNLSDYKSTLTQDNPVKVIKAEFKDPSATNAVEMVRLKWYFNRSGERTPKFTNVLSNRVAFQPIGFGTTEASAPPTIMLQMVQSGTSFSINDLISASQDSEHTNRATVYLVPSGNLNSFVRRGNSSDYEIGTYDEGEEKNIISVKQVAKTNDRSIKNRPFAVFCNPNGTDEFLCGVDIYLPRPNGGGNRLGDTFMFVLTLPYGEPDTEFSIDFYGSDKSKPFEINGTQVLIDSTGRANDLFRRVEVRMESADTTFPYPYYALQLLGDGNVLSKQMTVTYEGSLYDQW